MHNVCKANVTDFHEELNRFRICPLLRIRVCCILDDERHEKYAARYRKKAWFRIS